MTGSSKESLPVNDLPVNCLTLEDKSSHGNEQTILLNDLPENTEVVESWENLQEVRTISSLPNDKILSWSKFKAVVEDKLDAAHYIKSDPKRVNM